MKRRRPRATGDWRLLEAEQTGLIDSIGRPRMRRTAEKCAARLAELFERDGAELSQGEYEVLVDALERAYSKAELDWVQVMNEGQLEPKERL